MSAHPGKFRWDPSKLHFEFPIRNRETRLKALVLYICHGCRSDRTFSKTKLYKVLFFSDFEAYGRYREPLTGTRYKKFPFGPAPASFARLQDEMLRDHMIQVVKQPVHDHSRQILLPLEDPNISMFSELQMSIVDRWIKFFWNMPAKEVSRFSHGKAWRLATLGDPIPYDAVFISDDRVTHEEADKVKQLAKKYGWNT